MIYGTTSLNALPWGKYQYADSATHLHSTVGHHPPHQHANHRPLMWAPWHQEHTADPAQVHSHGTNWFEGAAESSWCTEILNLSKANFAKITRSENLHVSHVLQKAKVEVNVDRTKASAATTRNLITRASPWFIEDRTFLSFILHNPTSAVLLRGRQTLKNLQKKPCKAKTDWPWRKDSFPTFS